MIEEKWTGKSKEEFNNYLQKQLMHLVI